MVDGDPPSFQTTRELVGSDTELQWGGSDGKEWSDAIDTSTGVTVTDNGAVQTGSDIPDSVVDNFEDEPNGPYGTGEGIENYYDGDVGDVSRVSAPVQSGSFTVEMTVKTNRMVISSTSGLPRYPEQGDTFRAYIRFDSTSGGDRHIRFATQDETNTPAGYAVGPSPFDNTLEISYFDGNGNEKGLNRANQAWATGTWYEIEVQWGVDGSITATAYAGDTQLQQVTTTDTRYTGGGIGFGSNTPKSGEKIWYDSYEVIS